MNQCIFVYYGEWLPALTLSPKGCNVFSVCIQYFSRRCSSCKGFGLVSGTLSIACTVGDQYCGPEVKVNTDRCVCD